MSVAIERLFHPNLRPARAIERAAYGPAARAEAASATIASPIDTLPIPPLTARWEMGPTGLRLLWQGPDAPKV